MLNELFEKFPDYVAFQILTYRPHPDAELIKEHWRQRHNWLMWRRLHNVGMFRIRQDIREMYNRMLAWNEDSGEDINFYLHYIDEFVLSRTS
jgi:hypothetical protein